VICHSGVGFLQSQELGLEVATPGYSDLLTETDWEAIACAVCHDPHDASDGHPHQLRDVGPVTLLNGEMVTEGGYGKLCMNCHVSRRDADEYVEEYHRHYGPHYSNQTDMLVGTNAVEYGKRIRRSTHLYAVEDACAGCHMQSVPRTIDGEDNPIFTHAGGHTFKPVYDNGTPDDHSDDVDLTAPCVSCHGPMTTFDIPRDDYDGDGKVEGVQTEVEGLMHALALALPPLDEATVEVTEEYTPKQLKAAYNFKFVEEDGSHGIHNTQYAVGILKAAIEDLTGRVVVEGGSVRVLSDRPAESGGLVASAGPVGGSREMAGKLVPTRFGLRQNAPNPFNPETEILYDVAEPVTVRIDIYNGLGQRVRTLVEAHHNPGQYGAIWDGRDASGQKVTAGVYIYTMQAGAFVEGKKMVFMP
jgi:hypothetical protein